MGDEGGCPSSVYITVRHSNKYSSYLGLTELVYLGALEKLTPSWFR